MNKMQPVHSSKKGYTKDPGIDSGGDVPFRGYRKINYPRIRIVDFNNSSFRYPSAPLRPQHLEII
ncbi:hypothetical protein [Chitinophaga polysaccharea]|uniref:hypothetical protein n=1 Tax=Chitinophaga polysaccharea TaxID=1293035 RepID=UPI00115946E4|nr:hypothetical protein [Chitinophaga polysaccharea]